MCLGHSRDGMSPKPDTTHSTAAQSEGRACPLLHSPGQTGSVSWLWPQQLPHPDSTSSSTAWHDTAFAIGHCGKQLLCNLFPQTQPRALSSKMLLSQSYREKIWHSRARQQPTGLAQLHTAFLCIYSISVLVGRDQPCLRNFPFTS